MLRSTLCLLCCASIWTAHGCYTRDNPADPGRCDPACQAPEICWEGTCQLPPADGGPDGTQDQLPDSTPAGPAIVYKKCKANTATSSTNLSTINCVDGDFSVTVTANGTDKYLVILNLPDNWLECKLGNYSYHRGASFELKDGTETLTATGYTAPHGQRMPVTLVAAKVLSAGEHTIAAQWAMSEACPNAGGALKHGTASSSWLIVIRADPDDLQAVYGPTGAQAMGPNQDWADMAIPSITVPGPGGDYLLILTTPPTWGGGYVQYRLRRVHQGTDMAIGNAHVLLTAGAAGQSFPVSLVEATNLQPGDVIRAQWTNYSSSGNVQMIPVGGTVNVGWLVGLRTAKGILSSVRTTANEVSTTSTSPVAVPDLPLLEVNSKGGDHLFAFSVTQSKTCAYAPYYWGSFELHVDGAREAGGYFSAHGNSNLQPCQVLPMTLFAVTDLGPGKHNLGMEWFTSGSPYSSGKTGVTMAKLMALSR